MKDIKKLKELIPVLQDIVARASKKPSWDAYFCCRDSLDTLIKTLESLKEDSS